MKFLKSCHPLFPNERVLACLFFVTLCNRHRAAMGQWEQWSLHHYLLLGSGLYYLTAVPFAWRWTRGFSSPNPEMARLDLTNLPSFVNSSSRTTPPRKEKSTTGRTTPTSELKGSKSPPPPRKLVSVCLHCIGYQSCANLLPIAFLWIPVRISVQTLPPSNLGTRMGWW